MNPTRLFVASCISLVTSAFTFSVRGTILDAWGTEFAMSKEAYGGAEACVFYGMAFAMLVGGPLCDLLGMKNIMRLAFFSHVTGVVTMMFARSFTERLELDVNGIWWWLAGAAFVTGCGNGMVETGINPLIARLYPDRKTHYFNILHAWWPGGLIIGGLLSLYVGSGINLGEWFKIDGLNLALFGMNNWQTSLLLILLPALIYGFMVELERFPQTERVEAGVSYGEMMSQVFRPGFLLLAFCMLLTASTELAPQKWQESVMTRTAKVSGTMVLVYTSGIMFVMRHFAGPLAHAISPIGMLTASSVLSGVGLYLLSFADSAATAFGYATIYGIGIAYFWPTMLGVTAEKFPKGGALLLCLIGSVGNLGVAYAQTTMGFIYDRYAVAELRQIDAALADQLIVIDNNREVISPVRVGQLPEDSPSRAIVKRAEAAGAAWSFRWVAALPAVLVVIFGLWWLTDTARGGYKVESLIDRH